ncbi:ribonuclease HII [Candidatus Nomurabacteria bacterium]|nr:ribonuclease HII [Candidatus Nomurabacteria bacterium]
MKYIIGIDEVGRGPIAGPVAVCACAISLTNSKKIDWKGVNDSKKLSQKNRELWHDKAKEFKKRGLINYFVIYKSNVFIDKKGISLAIKECIKEALEKLKLNPKDCQILLDGSLKAPLQYKNQKTIIKGDQKEKIISLASVIAKVSRDRKMELLHKKYPKYNWAKNKGYGTREHYSALKKYGLKSLHRVTFLQK